MAELRCSISVKKPWTPGSPDGLTQQKPPLIDNALFKLESFTGFPLVISYNAKEYTGLLSTYSPTIALPDEQRNKFLKGVGSVINEHFGGTIEKILP